MELKQLQKILECHPIPLFFGGSFNPFHLGHKAIVQMLGHYFPSCPLNLLPNFVSPFKQWQKPAQPHLGHLSASQKIGLMQAVLQDLQQEFPTAKIQLELCELLREGPSYTADTLRELLDFKTPSSTLPSSLDDARCIFAMGSDSFCSLDCWKDWDYLLKTCIFVVFYRQGGAWKLPRMRPQMFTRCPQWQYILLKLEQPYSSSDIRQLLFRSPLLSLELSPKLQCRLENLLGHHQLRYIIEKGLYQAV